MKYIILFVFLFMSAHVKAEVTKYYYLDSTKYTLPISTGHYFLTSIDSIDVSQLLSNHGLNGQVIESGHQIKYKNYFWYLVALDHNLTDQQYQEKYEELLTDDALDEMEPVISTRMPTAVSNLFSVELKDVGDYDMLKQKSDLLGLEIVSQYSYMPKWFVLHAISKSSLSSIDYCNKIFETGDFEAVDPGFMFNFRPNYCSSEPLFSLQWGLSNSNGPDVNICGAWAITKGSRNVNVAVLDIGVDLVNSEFATKISNSIDIQSGSGPSIVYTTYVNSVPTPEPHATHVAGIIGALENNSLTVGVAPETDLMSISDDFFIKPTLSTELANGISWAWQQGADIINNSWGDNNDPGVHMQSSALNTAISDALLNGRNGLGTVVVFSSGNNSTIDPITTVDYPANSNPQILAVGSIKNDGTRSTFSDYGNGLDVVAPGEDIVSTAPGAGNYVTLSGTSMAAPFVSGTAALMIAVNPCLTQQQIHDAICKTAQKITTASYSYTNTSAHPLGSWNAELGYGLLDAEAAVNSVNVATTYLQNMIEGTHNYQNVHIRAGKNVTSHLAQGIYLVSGTGNVTAHAKDEVIMEDGFDAASGSYFEAAIVTNNFPCDNLSTPYPQERRANQNTIVSPIEGTNSPNSLGEMIDIYPNPVLSDLFIKYAFDQSMSIKINISNVYGESLYRSTYGKPKGIIEEQINIFKHLPAGFYFISICNGSNCFTKKVVKNE